MTVNNPNDHFTWSGAGLQLGTVRRTIPSMIPDATKCHEKLFDQKVLF